MGKRRMLAAVAAEGRMRDCSWPGSSGHSPQSLAGHAVQGWQRPAGQPCTPKAAMSHNCCFDGSVVIVKRDGGLCQPWQVPVWQTITISVSSRQWQQSSKHAAGFENRIASPRPEMRIRNIYWEKSKNSTACACALVLEKGSSLHWGEPNACSVFRCLIQTLELPLLSKMPVSVALHRALLNFSGFSSVVSISSLWTWMVEVFLKM